MIFYYFEAVGQTVNDTPWFMSLSVFQVTCYYKVNLDQIETLKNFGKCNG